MASLIPVQNLYYLFCYAWDRLEEGEVIDVGAVESPDLVDLFAKVLAGGVRHLLRRGVDRRYVERRDTLSTVRGRIDVSSSMSLSMRREPWLHCEFDELSANTMPNRILKATLLRLARVEGIDPSNARVLGTLNKIFGEVSDLRITKQHFHQVQLYRHNAYYGFLLNICELVHEAALPDDRNGRYRFSDILRDERKMALVFQAFVKNFFRIEQSKYEVRPLQLEWDAEGHEDHTKLLPKMTTDIHLVGADERIIIDTKYYRDALQENYGKLSLHSENLYQLFAYVKNAEKRGPEYSDVKGVLLYPAVGETPPFEAMIQGHEVRVLTINLDQPWQQIRADLLNQFGCGNSLGAMH
jgi:5-methylcytosine-specific restriction enzyme subunit McrC